jgi:hypothetical protein
MTRNLVVQAGLALSIILTTGTLQAQQDRLLADLYGRGVHAYFDGQLEVSHKLLSEVIEQKTQDPRAYYFRGVVLTRLGRAEQATKDFDTGATLEAKDVQKVYPVNRSLQRVQGKVRLTLETHRKEARLALRKYEEKRRRVRYEALKAAEKDVLRSVDRPAPGNAPKLPDDAKVDANNPFSGDEAGALGGGVAAPTKKKQTNPSSVANTRRRVEPTDTDVTTTNPGQPVAQPAAKPAAGANPFGGAPAAKPAAGANPFGGAPAAKPAAGANPFGGAPAAKPAAGANPFGGAPAAKPAAGANPFGGAPAGPENEAKPAANPFGDAPAAKPAPADGAKKSGGAFGALFRAVSKSIPGGDAPVLKSVARQKEPAVEENEEAPAKPAANPFGAAPGAKPAPVPPEPIPAKPAANPFGDAPGAKPAPAKPAANPFGAP